MEIKNNIKNYESFLVQVEMMRVADFFNAVKVIFKALIAVVELIDFRISGRLEA